MGYLGLLWRTQLRAVLAVVVVALALSVETFIKAVVVGPQSVLPPLNSASVVFLSVLSVGTVVAVVYGAPLYALAKLKHFASWAMVIVIGAVPGVLVPLLAPREPQLALWIAGSGLVVGALTHLSMRRVVVESRSNNTVERDARNGGARPSP